MICIYAIRTYGIKLMFTGIRAKTACFTGNRKIDENDLTDIMDRLDKVIITLAGQGVVYWGCGGCYGFDHAAAFAILNARKQNPAIKLILVLPCYGQSARWSELNKKNYDYLLERADKVVYVSEQSYFQGCMKKRNQYMIQHSSVCVAYMRYGSSGTSQTIRMAREHGLSVINLAELR